jgi:hypothetical protein
MLRKVQKRVRLFMAVVSTFVKEPAFGCPHFLKRKQTSSSANVFSNKANFPEDTIRREQKAASGSFRETATGMPG